MRSLARHEMALDRAAADLAVELPLLRTALQFRLHALPAALSYSQVDVPGQAITIDRSSFVPVTPSGPAK